MLELEDIVGKRFDSVELVVVEELKVEERNLFAIFPIGATIQDGGKRKEASEYERFQIFNIKITSHD